jgi:hypothetical protein
MNNQNVYQKLDQNSIDYQLYDFYGYLLRGPQSDREKYIAYLGGAQTFGRFCSQPFPMLLGEKLGIGTLNLGRGGAGPAYFLNHPKLLEATGSAAMAVIQVMSGRSVNNSVFCSSNNTGLGVRLVDQKKMTAINVFKDLILGQDPRGNDINFIKDLVQEIRVQYITEMISLLQQIKVPKVLFWFSTRPPSYQEKYDIYARHKERVRASVSQGYFILKMVLRVSRPNLQSRSA